jgi:hypothetical protein
LNATETIQLITTSRNAGLRGQSFWYYTDLIDLGFFGVIKNQAYQTKARVPDRRDGWRDEGRIQDDTSGNRSSGWINFNLPPSSSIIAWNRNFAYADDVGNKFLEFRTNVPATAWYEVYAHQVSGLLNLTTQAPFELYSNGVIRTIIVDQTNPATGGWYKLGDASLTQGANQLVARLTNANIGAGKFVAADAIMHVLNRRLSPNVTLDVEARGENLHPQSLRLLQNYPNPFNPTTNIVFQLPRASKVQLNVFDTLGRKVAALLDEERSAGTHTTTFARENLASGVYVVRLQAGSQSDTKKILLLR